MSEGYFDALEKPLLLKQACEFFAINREDVVFDHRAWGKSNVFNMNELKIETTSASIAKHYAGLLDGLLIDSGDAADVEGIAARVHAAPTLMTDLPSRVALARESLAFAERLSRR